MNERSDVAMAVRAIGRRRQVLPGRLTNLVGLKCSNPRLMVWRKIGLDKTLVNGERSIVWIDDLDGNVAHVLGGSRELGEQRLRPRIQPFHVADLHHAVGGIPGSNHFVALSE